MIDTFTHETDNRRKEIVWLALALLAALGLALFAVLCTGQQFILRSYQDSVIVVGLVAILGCAIAYFAGKEREQRHLNQSLVESLQNAVRQLHERVSVLDELAAANDELTDGLNRLQGELNESYLRALRALMKTLDVRDGYTARHGDQVTAIAVLIAERMGLESALVDVISRYGPLHDIGKIGVPDAVLQKPGALSEAEAALCRDHAALGETIVAPLRPGVEALAMFRSHHERWDGQGYPDGMAGADIPLLARILAVADAYHSMISQHPHRVARSDAQAAREITAHAGTQFDPDVVGVLGSLICEGRLR
jgi:HD-GYP domain-containing protein (c-di-GMP phosphodiesterase class II)